MKRKPQEYGKIEKPRDEMQIKEFQLKNNTKEALKMD